MRKLLLWMGTMWVGMVTIIVTFSLLIGTASGAGGFFSVVFVWLFGLGGGLLLSAPAFLNPPEDNGGIWSFRLPLPLWMFLMMMKLTSWIGFYILLGTWILIFKVWNNRQSNQLPTFSNAPQPQYGAAPQPYGAGPYVAAPQPHGAGPYGAPPQPHGAGPYGAAPQPRGGTPYVAAHPPVAAGPPPASWQADPTGRYPHRWWDGVRWTDRVANGGVQTIDPL
ncbi:DUF2510 domain-containing protein [Paractinoplanes globisporus]|uniref:DUF2510 domain-containing protein n=1 Tax=Paractinoplanes globisporus TaxID=113565 RepID=A0ABW6WAJ1_9ACTN|nr:DUF2510 domain-containing protein [Actinoplanes globisporus]